ncbi:MAG: hypothetical protein ACLFVI_06360 [Archaeoglobaceae archaeon]
MPILDSKRAEYYREKAEEYLNAYTYSILQLEDLILFAQKSVFPEYVDILGARREDGDIKFFSECLTLANLGKIVVTKKVPHYIKKGLFADKLSREDFIYWLSKDPQIDKILENVPEWFAAELIASGLGNYEIR